MIEGPPHSLPAQLRLYPAKFVGAIYEHRKHFLHSRPMIPEDWVRLIEFFGHVAYPPKTNFMSLKECRGEDLVTLLQRLPNGDPWNEAEVWPVYRYVRGSKQLALPGAFRAVLPVEAF